MEAHEKTFLETVEPRIIAALGLGVAAAIDAAPRDAAGIFASMNAVSARCNDAAARAGWETRPPLPGKTSGVLTVGNQLRVACATELWSGTEQLGVVFIVVRSARKPQINVAPPGCAIPAGWRVVGDDAAASNPSS